MSRIENSIHYSGCDTRTRLINDLTRIATLNSILGDERAAESVGLPFWLWKLVSHYPEHPEWQANVLGKCQKRSQMFLDCSIIHDKIRADFLYEMLNNLDKDADDESFVLAVSNLAGTLKLNSDQLRQKSKSSLLDEKCKFFQGYCAACPTRLEFLNLAKAAVIASSQDFGLSTKGPVEMVSVFNSELANSVMRDVTLEAISKACIQ